LDNIGIYIEQGADWIIKRNLHRESVQEWLKIAQEKGKKEAPREGKTVWRGETHRTVEGFTDPLRIVFKVRSGRRTANGCWFRRWKWLPTGLLLRTIPMR